MKEFAVAECGWRWIGALDRAERVDRASGLSVSATLSEFAFAVTLAERRLDVGFDVRGLCELLE